MYIGFDYGTANCSVAKMESGEPVLLNLEGDSPFIPSTLAAPTRESVSEHLFRHRDIKPFDQVGEQVLRRAINLNREESIELEPEDIRVWSGSVEPLFRRPTRYLLREVTKVVSWCIWLA